MAIVKIRRPGIRHFYDTVLAINPSGKASCCSISTTAWTRMTAAETTCSMDIRSPDAFSAGDHFAFSPRFDWYHDRDGFITTVAQKMKEFTLTADWKWKRRLLTRFEYRRDWSDQPFYDHGNGRDERDEHEHLAGRLRRVLRPHALTDRHFLRGGSSLSLLAFLPSFPIPSCPSLPRYSRSIPHESDQSRVHVRPAVRPG